MEKRTEPRQLERNRPEVRAERMGPDHEKMVKGATLTEKEIKQLVLIMKNKG